jgi:hypothetical protein
MDNTTVLLHNDAVTILLDAYWSVHNYFHMIVDSLAPAAYFLDHFQNGTLRKGNIPYRLVFSGGDSRLTRLANKDVCLDCIAAGRLLTMRRGEDPVLLDGTDRRMHCFCQIVHFLGGEYGSVSHERHYGQAILSGRLGVEFGELPYGVTPSYENYTRFGYWTDGLGKPKLLLVLRRHRRIGNEKSIRVMAQRMGFSLAVADFWSLNFTVRFHLSRYADVLMAIHGAELAFMTHMDATGPSGGCKSAIELVHFVRRSPHILSLYRDVAKNSRVRLFRAFAISAQFDPLHVSNPFEESRLLQQDFLWWTLPGFTHQTAFFDLKHVRRVLAMAARHHRRCTESASPTR